MAALRLSANTPSGVFQSTNKITKSVCEMCSTRCPISVFVKNGEVSHINGNELYSPNKTSVCARGAAGKNQLYDPQRLVTPLIRTGKRGSGEFREATYEEAFEYITKKLNEIKEKYGPESVVFTSKGGESYNQMKNFAFSYGSPNVFSHSSVCPVTYSMVLKHTFGGDMVRDFENARYVLNFGHNLFEGLVITDTKKLASFINSKDKKLVVLEPRFSTLSAKANEWIPVKPGTDLAFVMALIHIWLRDDKYDKEFVEKYTTGIDEVRKSVADATPQWQESITGISATTVERIADEIYKAAPEVIIDWGHKTTTTKAEYQRTRAIAIANALMGNIEKKGGIFFAKTTNAFNKVVGEELLPTLDNPSSVFKIPSIPKVDGAGEDGKNFFVSKTDGNLMEIPKAIISKKPYPIKAWVNTRLNYMINVAGTKKSVKALDELDFILSVDVYMNDFTQYADVVLPEATYLERSESILNYSGATPAFYMRNKAIEPINATKSGSEIFRELARKMGVDELYKYNNIDEYRMLQSKGDAKLLATLEKDGYIDFGVPEIYYREPEIINKFVEKYPSAAKFVDEDGHMSEFMKLKTKSKKVELFLADVEERFPGEGCLNAKDMDVFNGHEFCLTSGKHALHTNGHTQNIEILNDLMDTSPVWISTNAAKKHGLRSGDEVYLQNEFGKEKATLLVTEGIRDDTLFVYHGFGHTSKGLKRSVGVGLNQSVLLNPEGGKICGTMITNVGVDIVKAGV